MVPQCDKCGMIGNEADFTPCDHGNATNAPVSTCLHRKPRSEKPND